VQNSLESILSHSIYADERKSVSRCPYALTRVSGVVGCCGVYTAIEPDACPGGSLSPAVLVFNNFLTAVLIRTRIQELTLMVSSLTGPTGCGLCCTR